MSDRLGQIDDKKVNSVHVIKELMLTDPILAIQKLKSNYGSTERNFTERTYAAIAQAYKFAQLAAAKPKVLKLFYALPFFVDGHPPKGDRILMNTMCYMVGSRKKSSVYDRARVYTTALKPFFDKEWSPEKVLAKIEAKGTSWLYNCAVAAKRKADVSKGESREEEGAVRDKGPRVRQQETPDEEPVDDEGLDADQLKATSAIAKEAALDCSSKHRLLFVKVKGQSRLAKLMAMTESEEAVIVIRGGAVAGNFRPLRLTSLEITPREAN